MWQYYRNDPNDNITQPEYWNECWKQSKDVEIALPLNYFRNLWKTLKMSSINCEINLILTWSEDCAVSSATGAAKLKKRTDAKFYVPVVTLSTQDNAKLLQQLTSGFKRTINWNLITGKYCNFFYIKY